MQSDPSHPPSTWVRRFAPLIPAGGVVLDLACGGGRHTRYLRDLGHPVVAVDLNIHGVADLENDPDLEIIQADLEGGEWPLTGRRFSAVTVTNYLHRPLFPHLAACLAGGGLLIYETFSAGHEQLGRPRNPDFLLQPGELVRVFATHLTVLAAEEGYEALPAPAVRQRLCARK